MEGVDYPIAIVGAGSIETELKQQVEKLNLKNIHFLGVLPDEDKCALLELCYGVVFPSHLRSEAFGITLLEGAMYGKPLVSSEIGTGTTYINIHSKTGLIIPPSNPQALCAAMTQLWNDSEQCKLFGSKARERYQKLFTAEKMVEQYSELYKSLLSS